jgi:hypothetical protein
MKKKLFRTINTIKSRKANQKKREMNHFLRQHFVNKKINAAKFKNLFLNRPLNEEAPKITSFNDDKEITDTGNNVNLFTFLSYFMMKKRQSQKHSIILID